MDKDEAALRASKGFQDALKSGLEAVDMADLLARQKAINDAHNKIIDLPSDEWKRIKPSE